MELKVLGALVGFDLPLGIVGQELQEESVDGVSRFDLHRHGDEKGDEEHDAAGQGDDFLCRQLHLQGKQLF